MSGQGPHFLTNPDLQLILFGGKGGAGKTTSAAATAVHIARTEKNKRVLVVSTDPAHSLADSFHCSMGNEIASIKGIENLWALEIKAEESLEDFRRRHGELLKEIVDRGTYFDQQDIAKFFSLSFPGLDEVMAIIEVMNIHKDGLYDLIILDTAPTGHTLRLLALPRQMERWIHVLDLMQEKHRFLMRRFTGRTVKDPADKFLEGMLTDIKRVSSLLRDPRVVEFVPVTLPEPMALYETERLLRTLGEYKISVKSIVANRVMEAENCPFCSARKRDGEKYVREMEERFTSYRLVKMPLFPYEIRGLKALTEFGEILFGKTHEYKPSQPSGSVPKVHPVAGARMSDLLNRDLEFILFGGKGGVGKTSAAAATALHMTRSNPRKKVLVFSTDPAHSLSDSLAIPIGDKVTPVGVNGNLHALEINAAKLFQDFKEEFIADIEEVFDKFLAGGVDIKFDREVMTELVNLSPPGLDEMMALKEIVDLREDGSYDLFIIDTAPTGHLLRFLEAPELARDWLKFFFRLLVKYKQMVRLTSVAERLVELSRNIRRVQDTLTDLDRSEFIAVCIPEAMGVLETGRLLSSLKKLKIPCHQILVNMVIPPTDCAFCGSKRREQQRYVEELLGRNSSKRVVAQMPLFPHEVRGIADLREFSACIYGG